MNKPLMKDEREAAMTYSDRTDADWVPESIIKDLLSAEAFWREAVKNAYEHGSSAMCVFCDHDCRRHAPHCPWLLAQES